MDLGILLSLLIPLLPGCSAPEGQAAGDPPDQRGGLYGAEEADPGSMRLRFQDAEGGTLVLPAYPSRIISLVPSATQTLLALGAQGLLVARTDFDTDSVLAHLPSVGSGLQPSLEAVLGLGPDLVIRFAGESDRVTPRRLRELGIAQWSIRPDRISDVRQIMMDLGSLTGQPGRADSLLSVMDSTFAEMRRLLQGRREPKVAYLLGGNPPWVAGGGTFLDELLKVAGGSNAFEDLGILYGPVSPEEFLVRDIDLILIPRGSEVSLPGSGIPMHWVSPELELPGPNLARAALELAGILHPEVFR